MDRQSFPLEPWDDPSISLNWCEIALTITNSI